VETVNRSMHDNLTMCLDGLTNTQQTQQVGFHGCCCWFSLLLLLYTYGYCAACTYY
jgi:hypothetical protein